MRPSAASKWWRAMAMSANSPAPTASFSANCNNHPTASRIRVVVLSHARQQLKQRWRRSVAPAFERLCRAAAKSPQSSRGLTVRAVAHAGSWAEQRTRSLALDLRERVSWQHGPAFPGDRLHAGGRVHQNGGRGAPNRGSRRGGSAARGRKGRRIALAWKMLCFPTESWHVNCIFAGFPRLSFPNSPKEPSHVPTLIPLIPLIPTFPPIPTTGHLR
jgi:hypothetical protein